MIPVDTALDIVLKHTPSLGSEEVPLADALGRVLGEDVRADADMPPFDRSAMDGYAVRASDVAEAPVVLEVAGQVRAGQWPDHPLPPGQAVQVMTGAPVPPGTTAVQPVEKTRALDRGGRGPRGGAGRSEEIRGHPAFARAKRAEPMSGMNARLAKPGAHRLPDHRLQPAAVDGELRDVIARIGPAQLAPYLLAETVGVEQLVGSDPHRIEPIEQSKLGQFLDCMRQGVDADAELADGVRLFVDFAVDTARMQHQRRGQAADSASDDDHFHGSTRKNARIRAR